MIDLQAMMLFTGVALITCAILLAFGLMVTMTGGNIWWVVPAMGIPGAALAGGSGLD